MEREGGCLDDESIIRFLAGRADTSTRTSIERHVDDCAACALLILPSGSRPVAGLRSTHALVPGERVAERYCIERLIGGGGMGEVYSALDEQLGERIALKTLRATIGDDGGAIARLKSEVQLARRVTHPNVCRTYDLGSQPGPAGHDAKLAFLTMELLAGRTLSETIRSRGALPEANAREVARQIVAGLMAAHGAGVIHKDLKSDNVILATATGSADDTETFSRAVITDFGLAASAERAVAPNDRGHLECSGTAGYIAPERLRGAPATPASDVYSLGVVILDMIDGRCPARPRSPAESPDLDLRGIAHRCCAPQPAARPTLSAIADLLAEPQKRPSARSSRPSQVAGAAVVLATTIGVLVAWSRPAPRPPSMPTVASQPTPDAPLSDTVAPPSAVALPSSSAQRPPRMATASRPGHEVRRRATAAAQREPTRPPAATVDMPAGTDEPIRSLDLRRQSRPAVTLETDDDAPIDPFSGRR